MPEVRTDVKMAATGAGVSRVYKRGAFVLDDCWQRLGDAEPPPPGAAVVVSIDRWRAEREMLLARTAGVGIAVTPPETVQRRDLADLRLVAVHLPKFTDGRAYSLARRLREQCGYEGELRATGDVLFDQLVLLARCGFDSFEISHGPTIAALERVAPGLSHVYQPPVAARRMTPMGGEYLRRRSA